MRPVRMKPVEQQALQGMHRIRSLWMGARTGIESISRVLADPNTAVPDLIRGTAKLLVEKIRLFAPTAL